MLNTPVPGTCASHVVINDTVRGAQGDEGAIRQALAHLEQKYRALVDSEENRTGQGVEFHVALTVCRPRHRRDDT